MKPNRLLCVGVDKLEEQDLNAILHLLRIAIKPDLNLRSIRYTEYTDDVLKQVNHMAILAAANTDMAHKLEESLLKDSRINLIITKVKTEDDIKSIVDPGTVVEGNKRWVYCNTINPIFDDYVKNW